MFILNDILQKHHNNDIYIAPHLLFVMEAKTFILQNKDSTRNTYDSMMLKVEDSLIWHT